MLLLLLLLLIAKASEQSHKTWKLVKVRFKTNNSITSWATRDYPKKCLQKSTKHQTLIVLLLSSLLMFPLSLSLSRDHRKSEFFLESEMRPFPLLYTLPCSSALTCLSRNRALWFFTDWPDINRSFSLLVSTGDASCTTRAKDVPGRHLWSGAGPNRTFLHWRVPKQPKLGLQSLRYELLLRCRKDERSVTSWSSNGHIKGRDGCSS